MLGVLLIGIPVYCVRGIGVDALGLLREDLFR